jgi:hypothetical protein
MVPPTISMIVHCYYRKTYDLIVEDRSSPTLLLITLPKMERAPSSVGSALTSYRPGRDPPWLVQPAIPYELVICITELDERAAQVHP